MIRGLAAAALVIALSGCASPSTTAPGHDPEAQQTTEPTRTPTVESPAAPACITVSAMWVEHIQYFMEDGYTVTRAAAAPADDDYTSIAIVYTSPASEEILGGWGTGGDPASDAVMQVFPLDDTTASHTVAMMPRLDIVAAAGTGSPDAIACLG
jgi:hypothetical protein